jgi:WD40 repeat protein
MYALPDGKLIRTITHAAAVSTVAFASAGHDLVSGSVDGSVLITRDNREPVALPSFSEGIDVAGLLPDGRVVATTASRRLRVYDPGRNAVLAELTTTSRVQLLRPSADGRRLIGASRFWVTV